MMSPGGILLAGAGAAVAILAGAPLVAAAGVGALAWGGRVLAAVGDEPGHAAAAGAQRAVARLRPERPGRQAALRPDRRLRRRRPAAPAPGDLSAGSTRASTSRGASPSAATRSSPRSGRSTPPGAAAELAELEAAGRRRRPAGGQTIESLRAQLAAAERLSTLAEQSRDRLRLLDARFDELIARAVEVSVGSGDSEVLGHDVDQLVTELESLRVAMEETDKLSGLQTQTWPPAVTARSEWARACRQAPDSEPDTRG